MSDKSLTPNCQMFCLHVYIPGATCGQGVSVRMCAYASHVRECVSMTSTHCVGDKPEDLSSSERYLSGLLCCSQRTCRLFR